MFEHPDFLDADHGWIAAADCAGGRAKLFETDDGGMTWTHVVAAGPTCNAGAGLWPIAVDDSSTVYYMWSEPTGGFAKLYRSTDGGASFGKPKELPVSGPLMGPPGFDSPTVGWLAGVRDGHVALERTTDAGHTWHAISVPRPTGDIAFLAPWQPPTFDGDVGVLPVFSRNKGMWRIGSDRSFDGGFTWHRGPGTSVPGRYAPSVDVADPSTWWVASRGDDVERTTDAGASWTHVRGPRGFEIGHLDAVDDSTAWVLASHHEESDLFLTGNGGRTWRHVQPAAPPFRTVATLHALPMGLLAGPNGSIYAREMAGNKHTVVVGIDPSTGHTISSPVLRGGGGRSGADQLAAFRGVIWFAGQDPFYRHVSTTLVRLDAGTLRRLPAVRLPAPPAAVAAGPVGVWVAAGHRLLLLDAAGRIVRSIDIGVRITHLAVDPSDTRLYVSSQTAVDKHNHVVFESRSASTGALITSSRDIGFASLGGPSAVVPIEDGIWVASPSGMMAALELFDPSTLAPVGTAQDGHGFGLYEGTNAVSASFAGGVLWISDVEIELMCADARSGAVIERIDQRPVQQPPDFTVTNVIETSSGVYASNEKDVVRIDPGSRCLRST